MKNMNRRQFLAALSGAPALLSAPRRPNIVLILADDLGYGDLGVYGATTIRTPNLDRMAAEGVRFTHYYAPASVCTPTRAALMTGCYPMRVGLGYRVLFPYSTTGLHPDEITVAEVLKDAGYATACVGKWHLGWQPKFLPTRQGFDSYYGIPYSNDMGNVKYNLIQYVSPPLPLMRDEKIVESGPEQRYLTKKLTEEAVRFIEAGHSKPFFLYLAHHMPHVPIAASEQFAGRSPHGLYGDVIEELDWSVGEVLAALRRAKVDDNTLVLFTSDNGGIVWEGMGQRGYRSGSNGPLRGAKATTWEGGIRAPLIAWWPGHIPAGRVSHEIATGMDVLPTFAHLGGGRVPTDRIIDGKNMWPLLSGQPGARSQYEAFYIYNDYEELNAVRSGKWKLHLHPHPRFADPGMKGPLLYDLESDPGERRDVAAAHPDVVKRLMQYAERAREDLGDGRLRKVGRNVRTVGHA
jgi:arylsulfatase A